MIKARKMTAGQMKKILDKYSKKELLEIIEELYRNSSVAADYLNIRLGNGNYESAFVSEYKEKVYNGFFTRSGKGRLLIERLA